VADFLGAGAGFQGLADVAVDGSLQPGPYRDRELDQRALLLRQWSRQMTRRPELLVRPCNLGIRVGELLKTPGDLAHANLRSGNGPDPSPRLSHPGVHPDDGNVGIGHDSCEKKPDAVLARMVST